MGYFKELFSKINEKKLTGGNIRVESYDEEIMKNRIIIFLIPGKIYQFGVLSITKSVANRFNRILYMSLNKTADKIIGLLKENNIDTKKILIH